MSKAFTSEDAPPEVLLRPHRLLEPGEKRYVTRQGYRVLQQALERLQEERAGSREIGHRAELEVQAQSLADTLSDLTVVAPDPAQAGRAFFGAWVTLEDEDGEELRYRLVGPDEADARAGLISVDSPLARAILGREAGEELVVDRPRGRVEYTLVRVQYEDA